ncbi:phosphoenolpyruvate--protein phosphotransferase [Spiroplasma endosymbiont of Lariophagus distinguendus]|uniref:phosphoenolpyruvate--protein phosphotransferase n=1 Tax=Spiroplasma endosymbiont of Lariophagus distinguendus TaxID=2935082 RepID=UPI00207A2C9D|nr:phosphoenolpyruvate--protein phosphotransferase [Spiroplasma endosymbiont of Lariophagus distinguendus]
MLKMKGIGASNGIALAKALILKHETIKTNPKKIDEKEIEGEVKKLHDALKIAGDEIKQLIQNTTKTLGEEKAAVFEAHFLVTTDTVLIEDTEKLIKEEKYNAANALESTANKAIATFQSMDDDYFRERAADVIDVRDRILRKILNIKTIDLSAIKEETIIVSHDLTPSETSQLNPKFVKGFLCDIGGRTSHAAIMARSLGIPAVLGLKNVTTKVKNNQFCVLDGNTGEIEIDLNSSEKNKWVAKQNAWIEEQKELLVFKGKLTKTSDNHEVKLEANIGSPKDMIKAIEYDAQGVGLFRSEFLYMESSDFPSEDIQFEEYKKVLSATKHKVVIRTLDIGGDKELSYLDLPKEMNPFLGYRAIRLCLDRKDIFKTQLRALIRASAFGKLAIMFPMIATVEEFKAAKALYETCKKELIKEKVKVSDDIQVGMMIEIPAAAVNAETFAKYADFFSIGTNDLIQYSLAVDRMSEKVSYLYQPYHPSILRLIKMTIDCGHKYNRPVAMCGEMAGDKIAVPLLVGLGLDEFSMSASSVLETRKIISTLNKKDTEILASKALQCETNEEVKSLVEKFLSKK